MYYVHTTVRERVLVGPGIQCRHHFAPTPRHNMPLAARFATFFQLVFWILRKVWKSLHCFEPFFAIRYHNLTFRGVCKSLYFQYDYLLTIIIHKWKELVFINVLIMVLHSVLKCIQTILRKAFFQEFGSNDNQNYPTHRFSFLCNCFNLYQCCFRDFRNTVGFYCIA